MRKNTLKRIFNLVSTVVIISLFFSISYANDKQESVGLSDIQIPMNDSLSSHFFIMIGILTTMYS